MVILGLERPVEYGSRQIFDPTMANMVLNAQNRYVQAMREDYLQGREDLKEFNKNFGDFFSPIQKDMEWYDQNVTGATRDLINNLYAQGMDMRNPEFRSAVSRFINNMPVGKINQLKQSAAMANEYLKNKAELESEGLYNEDFERSRLGGHLIDDWDTNTMGMWKDPTPSKFKDLNTWTSHLFDNMELSYDPEESKKYPGYKAYTKSKDTMSKIVDARIAQLLDSDLGKYYLKTIEGEIPDSFSGNRRNAAINELKERIIDSNWERSQVKLESDPYALARYQNSLRASYGGGGGGHRNPSTKMSYNWMNGLFQRGLTSAFGYSPTTGEEDALNNIVKDQFKFGQSLASKNPYSSSWAAYKDKSTAYLNQFTIYEEPAMFQGVIGRSANKNGEIPLTRADLDNLRTQEDVVTNTYGYPNVHIKTDKKKIHDKFNTVPVQVVNQGEGYEDDYQGIVMVPYRDVYTSYQKYGAVDQQWKVAIINNKTGKHLGDYWYTIPNTREYNSDVPSISEWQFENNEPYIKDSDGNRRDLAKGGVNKNIRGWNERASWLTSGMMGVTSQPFNRDVDYNQEGVALSPYRR